MSLHDRIMAMDHGYEGACFAFNDGYGEARKDAAQIAKEADELMRLLAEDLYDQCTNPNDYTDALLERYKEFRSNTK